MTQLYKSEVDRAIEILRKEMIADPGPVIPRLLAFPPLGAKFPPLATTGLRGLDRAGILVDDILVAPFDPGLMSSWQGKNLIGSGIVILCFHMKARVTVFLSDALFGAAPAGKTFDDMPRNLSEWPKSLTHEALLINVNAIGMKGYALGYDYTRDGKGRRVFAARPEPIKMEVGRFCYDLTDATGESALLDALSRGRDGGIEQQA